MKALLRANRPIHQPIYNATIDGFIRKRRHELALPQETAAAQLGVSEWTYRKWENGNGTPSAGSYPAILAFLGYEPWPTPVTLGEKLRAERLRRGLSINRAAQVLGVDEGTYGRWERDQWVPQAHARDLLASFLGAPVEERNRARGRQMQRT